MLNYIAEKLVQTEDCQVVILGTGEAHYEESLRYFADKYPKRFKACLKFDLALSNKLYAASDFFLMPSIFEPCGISQMIAMHYGSLPIARETGGLCDTITPYNKYTHTGTGFTFANINANEFLDVIRRALAVYRASLNNENQDLNCLIKQAMIADFSWQKASLAYRDLYESMLQ